MLVVFSMIACFLLGAMVFSQQGVLHAPYENRKKAYVVFSCTLLGLQSGLRDVSVGPDTIQYGNRYELASLESWDSVFSSVWNYYLEGNTGGFKDPCYSVLEKAFQITGLDYRAWLIFVAVVFFASFGYFLHRNTRRISDVCFALLLYMIIFYGFYSVTGLRQTLAMALCLWSFEMAKRRQFGSFVILVLLASSLHKSACLFLPSYLLVNFNNPRALLGLALLAVPIVFAFRFQLTGLFGSIMGYEMYAEGFEGAGASGYALLSLIAAALIWWKCDSVLCERDEMRTYLALFAISIIVIPALWVDPSIMRVVQYYSIFILPLFPAVLRSFDWEFSKRASCSSSCKRSSAAVSNDTKAGHFYLLCMMLLTLYCCKRFIGYDYSFFFMG